MDASGGLLALEAQYIGRTPITARPGTRRGKRHKKGGRLRLGVAEEVVAATAHTRVGTGTLPTLPLKVRVNGLRRMLKGTRKQPRRMMNMVVGMTAVATQAAAWSQLASAA